MVGTAVLSAFCVYIAAPAVAATFPGVERSSDPISIVYPQERQTLPGDGAFVLGSVSDPKAAFEINGQTVAVRANGAFLAWLPVQAGTFTFRGALALKSGTTSYTRTVWISPPATALPAKPATIDKDSVWPKADLELRAGDWLLVGLRASPGLKAKFKVPGRAWQPMREVNPALGVYEGAYLVMAGEEQNAEPIEFKVGSGWSSAEAKSAGKVALLSGTPPVGAVRGVGPASVKTGPGGGELFPIPGGARFLVLGRQGSDIKVGLSREQTGWIDARSVELLPPGAQPPQAVTDVVGIKPGDGETVVRIGLTDRVPAAVEESADLRGLTVRLYSAYAHTNWIVYDSADEFVESARVRQESPDVVAVDVRLREGRSLWGYRLSYEGSSVKLELRHPPRIAAAPASPLLGRAVFLDPGHMPSAPGAIGPLGTREMDVNYAIAKAVEKLLIKEGAKPILSRAGETDEVGLNDRPRAAWDKKADLFVSIHNNNLPDGTNPFAKAHGFSIFYYHPHSLSLARDVYRAYQRLVPLPGEDLRFGNLLVARMTEMPAILTESAYMTYPEQEASLLDAGFRNKLAEGIVSGLRDFLEREHRRQLSQPLARSAAPSPKPRARRKSAKARRS